MTTGPWSVAVGGGSGLSVVFDKFVPDRSYALWFGKVHVKDKANLDWLMAKLNRLCRLAGIGPTKTMLGNARRRALMSKVEARTEVTFPMVSFACAGCGDPQEARMFSRWDCDNCEYYWWPVMP